MKALYVTDRSAVGDARFLELLEALAGAPVAVELRERDRRGPRGPPAGARRPGAPRPGRAPLGQPPLRPRSRRGRGRRPPPGRRPARWRGSARTRPAGFRIGVSTHSAAEAAAAIDGRRGRGRPRPDLRHPLQARLRSAPRDRRRSATCLARDTHASDVLAIGGIAEEQPRRARALPRPDLRHRGDPALPGGLEPARRGRAARRPMTRARLGDRGRRRPPDPAGARAPRSGLRGRAPALELRRSLPGLEGAELRRLHRRARRGPRSRPASLDFLVFEVGYRLKRGTAAPACCGRSSSLVLFGIALGVLFQVILSPAFPRSSPPPPSSRPSSASRSRRRSGTSSRAWPWRSNARSRSATWCARARPSASWSSSPGGPSRSARWRATRS